MLSVSELVESHCRPLDLPKESCICTCMRLVLTLYKITAKGPISWPELWLYNEFPGRCNCNVKGFQSHVLFSEAEGFNIPIDVQPTYEYFYGNV